MSEQSPEKRAARTTIVGGQPEAANSRELPPVPVGIEQILTMAAVDERFAHALEEDRQRAMDASGVALTPSERAIMSSVDEGTLSRMAARVSGVVPHHDRREFLGKAAAAMLAFVGGGALVAAATGCREGRERGGGGDPTAGITVSPPETPPTPDAATATPPTLPDQAATSDGGRSDGDATPDADAATPTAGDATPAAPPPLHERPVRNKVNRGIAPRRRRPGSGKRPTSNARNAGMLIDLD